MTLVLARAEIKNHFAKVKETGKINSLTITEQEDFNIGKSGYQVTLKAFRSNISTVFFAGPRAGGRLGMGDAAPEQASAHQRECFTDERGGGGYAKYAISASST